MNLSLRYLVAQRFYLCPFFQFSESNRVMISDIHAAKQFSSFLVSRCSSHVFRSNFGYFLKCAIVFESLDYKNTLFTSLITISDTVSSLVSNCQFSNCNNRAIYCDKTSSNLTILKSDFFYCGVSGAYGGAIHAKCSILLLEKLCFYRCYAISNHCTAYYGVSSVRSEANLICCLKCPDTEACHNHVAGIECATQNNSNHNYTNNNLAVNAGIGIFKGSKQSILQFYTSNGHAAGGAICFYLMSVDGIRRYGNIFGNNMTKGAVIVEKATTTISNFYIAGNSGQFTYKITSGAISCIDCSFDRSSITTELDCSTCINCAYSTNGMSSYHIIQLNTGRCEGDISSNSLITKTNYFYYFIRTPIIYIFYFTSLLSAL